MLRFGLAVLMIVFGTVVASAETLEGRKFEIVDGRASKSEPGRVVVVMHGFLGTPRYMRRTTGFAALAKRHGFIAVFPKGKNRRWNDGRSPNNRVDDVRHLTGLVSGMIADGRADRRQIFWAGHSNGGGMAMRIACDRPDLVAGIAVVATKMPVNFQCPRGGPIPAVFLHGTADPIAPHDGRSRDSRLGATLSAQATIEAWRKRNKCSGKSRRQTIDRRDDGTVAVISRYSGCAAPLTYVLVEGHGHDWPEVGKKPTRLQGPATQEIGASSLSWQFFEKL